MSKKWSHLAHRSDLTAVEIAEILRVVAMALLSAACANKDIQRLYDKAIRAVESLL